MSLVFLEAKLESLVAEGCHLKLAMTEDGVRLVDIPGPAYGFDLRINYSVPQEEVMRIEPSVP